ncbi:hypothetical protein MA9V1_224 [Chryseobacterium phage MA9V-1]|nr:hypothetical protein MA9V1_224 [Chryseobacterium phage MA9V-1]
MADETLNKLPVDQLPAATSATGINVVVHKDGVLMQSAVSVITSAVNAEITTIKADVATAKADASAAKGDLDVFKQNEFAPVKAESAATKTLANTNKTDIATLKTNNTANKADIATLKTTLTKDGKIVVLSFEADGTVKWAAGT